MSHKGLRIDVASCGTCCFFADICVSSVHEEQIVFVVFISTSIHMEQLLEWYADRRVVWIDLHYIGHHVPPSLCYGVYVFSVLAVCLLVAFLYSEEDVSLLVPEYAVVADTLLLYHLDQFWPNGGVTLFIFFLAPFLEVHLKCKSFHKCIFFS